jgi:two-component system chemotaxis response regulator CheB
MNHGGRTIAEHESTCIVYGMPRSAIEAGVVDKILPANAIADEIIRTVKGKAEVKSEGVRI